MVQCLTLFVAAPLPKSLNDWFLQQLFCCPTEILATLQRWRTLRTLISFRRGYTVDNILNDLEVRSLERLLRVKKRLGNEGLPPVRLLGRSLLVRRSCDKELSESRASASSVAKTPSPQRQVSKLLTSLDELAGSQSG